MGMNPKEKAIQLANSFVSKSVFDMTNDELNGQRSNAKLSAKLCVDEIVYALEITTGHCTLNHNDVHEVNSDLDYWSKVKSEIDKLHE
jgi:hypothetical protein